MAKKRHSAKKSPANKIMKDPEFEIIYQDDIEESSIVERLLKKRFGRESPIMKYLNEIYRFILNLKYENVILLIPAYKQLLHLNDCFKQQLWVFQPDKKNEIIRALQIAAYACIFDRMMDELDELNKKERIEHIHDEWEEYLKDLNFQNFIMNAAKELKAETP